MPNRLAREQSPYLLQHKDNPVDWFAWSDEAFRRASEEDKPIFLSIGYSTCHWCHVMEHESFEDPDVARLMNDAFISIKVDREERPDIDGVYMTVCQMMTGHGGWPLTIVMTPDKRPFHAATYIPKESRAGRIGMIDLVPRIKDVWERRRDEVLETSGRVTEALERSVSLSMTGSEPSEDLLHRAFEELQGRFDERYGGFGREPKFPSPHNLTFLLRYWHRSGENSALEMVERTLDHMSRGGIFDQVGFGFHRYSTDRVWRLPHFEKMLYDQALLAIAYTEAFQATSNAAHRRTAERVFEYVLRDLRSPEGAFYSAEDADSEGREGKFYVWTTAEIRDVLDPPEAELIIDLFGLRDEGNFEEEATRRRTGENVLFLDAPLSEAAEVRGESLEDLTKRVERARSALLAHRSLRVRPALDDKILTDWNGLMIAALARASSVFDDPSLASAAAEAAEFITTRMRDAESRRLLHRYRDGKSGIRANLDDYAYLIWGLLELYEASFDVSHLKEAIQINADLIEYYWDEQTGGFFFTAEDAETVLVRRKEYYDGAVPSGNAVAMLNLLRLERITGDAIFGERAWRVATSTADALGRMPSAFTGLLSAVDFALGPTQEIVITGDSEGEDTRQLLTVVRTMYLPNKVMLFRPSDDVRAAAVARIAPFVEHQRPVNGAAAAYVCRNFSCDAPVTTASDLRSTLEHQ